MFTKVQVSSEEFHGSPTKEPFGSRRLQEATHDGVCRRSEITNRKPRTFRHTDTMLYKMIAAALGAPVYPGGHMELGFAPVSVNRAGAESPLRHIVDVPVLHWHSDTFDLPDNVELLASTGKYAHQAFRRGQIFPPRRPVPELTHWSSPDRKHSVLKKRREPLRIRTALAKNRSPIRRLHPGESKANRY